MLIIFEEVDQGGKTTLAKRISKEMDIPYIKLKNINIDDNEKIHDNVSVSTHSQIETVVQLYEQGVMKDAILDRFHISEYVFSRLFDRKYDTGYISDIENRLSKFNDVLIIRCRPSNDVLIERWKQNEKLLDLSMLSNACFFYDEYFTNLTKLPVVYIDTGKSEELAFMELVGELYKRGVYKNHPRPRRQSHKTTMINIAKEIAKRGTCLNRQVGAVLTEDGFIIGCGYNGPPSGLKHCETCVRREKGFKSGEAMELSRALHAEENAIIQSGIRSKSDKMLELFTTDSPCIGCTKKLIQIGIKRIHYVNRYNDELAWEMLREANVETIQYSD